MSYRIAPFVLLAMLVLSGCWETQCLSGPDAAGRTCYEEQSERERCERQQPREEKETPPDYERY